MASELKPISCQGRIEKALARLEDADSYLFPIGPQIRWLSGFSGSSGWLLVSDGVSRLFVDGRYDEQAKEQVDRSGANVDVVLVANQADLFKDIWQSTRGSKTGFAVNSISVGIHQKLQTIFGEALVPASDPTTLLRRTKSEPEVERIALAAKCADQALSAVIEFDWQGKSERELARRIEIEIRNFGGEREAFETIVASGPNGSRPHHRSGDRIMSKGDSVIIDMGAVIDGYHSDMTRTFFLGQPASVLTDAFHVVIAAQDAGVRALSVGISAAEIDRECRRILSDAGLEHYFVTGTGHGIGLEIHEDPYLGKSSTDTLILGEVLTVEPGIYCEGVGGIRIEDTVSLEVEGPRRLTLSSKDPSCPQ